jgi:hypothetical protein
MGKPFEVTVMHDYPEQPAAISSETSERVEETTLNTSKSKTKSADMSKSVISLSKDPTNEELLTSIDALRPQDSYLDPVELRALMGKLKERYKASQLSMYLHHELQLPTPSELSSPPSKRKSRTRTTPISAEPFPSHPVTKEPGDIIRRSWWKAGRTDIGRRVGQTQDVRKIGTGRSKQAIIHRILKSAWGVRTSEDTHSIGEVELYLRPRQYAYLFSLSPDGTPVHQSFIDTPFLRKISRVEGHPADNVMRITARQTDAEDIANQISRNLNGMGSMKKDMKMYQDLFGKGKLQEKLQAIWTPVLRADVGRRTDTFIELVDAYLYIYGKTDHDVTTADRILEAFLPLPSPTREETLPSYFLDEEKQRCDRLEGSVRSYEYGGTEMSLRHRHLSLSRLVLPKEKTEGELKERRHTVIHDNPHSPLKPSDIVIQNTDKLTRYLTRERLALPFDNPEGVVPPPWAQSDLTNADLTPSPWRIEFGGIVEPDHTNELVKTAPDEVKQRKGLAGKKDQLLLRSRMPNMTSLLSYYDLFARRHVRESPSYRTVVAHFTPSPTSKLGLGLLRQLPRIEASFDASKSSNPLRQVVATLARQIVWVPLPEEAVDMCFVRDIFARVFPIDMLTDSFEKFTETLLNSPGHGLDSLRFETEVLMKLPTSWLVSTAFQKSIAGGGLSSVPYRFDRFEVKEVSTFAPSQDVDLAWVEDESMQYILKDKAIRLRYQEVNSGIIGGSRRELRISRELDSTGERTLDTKQLVENGLHLVRAFTRIADGDLKPAWEHDAWRRRPRVRPRDGVDAVEVD